jgi:regulatory protein
MTPEKIKKLKNSAMRYTAYRERSPKEVLDKLAEWDTPKEIAEQILIELKAEGFVDEYRFARAFCHDKFLINKWGKRRIEMELSKFKVSGEAVQQGLAYINPEEYLNTLKKLVTSKWQKTKEPDIQKRKAKTVNYLVQKGYEMDLVWEAVGGLVISD